MLSTDFIFLLIMWLLARKTSYHKIADMIVFGVFIIHCIQSSMMYIPKRLESYQDGDIRPGYIVSSFLYAAYEPEYIVMRQMLSLISGYPYFHTALAVEHRGETYILHCRSPHKETDEFIERHVDKDRIDIIYTHGEWSFRLEPLRCFLDVEKKYGSRIRIMDTGRRLIYDKKIGEVKPTDTFIHCCYFVGKYLERLGICTNPSLLKDGLYYTPKFFSNTFRKVRDVKL